MCKMFILTCISRKTNQPNVNKCHPRVYFTSSLHLHPGAHVDELWLLADFRATDEPEHEVRLLLCHLQL